VKRFCDVLGASLCSEAEACRAVADILFHGEMREKCERLKNVGQLAAAEEEEKDCRRVEEFISPRRISPERAAAGLQCNSQQRGLPEPEGPKRTVKPGAKDGGHIKRKGLRAVGAKRLADLTFQHGEVYFTPGRPDTAVHAVRQIESTTTK